MTERDQSAINEVAAVAASVTIGEVNLLRACRIVVGLQHRLGDVPAHILDPIRAVESELDYVPDEMDTLRWEPHAFDRMVLERDEYLKLVQPLLLECFRGLHAFLAK